MSPRSSHTISRFKGVSLTDSVANIPPDNAIDSLNVFADSGGYITQFQQPSVLWPDPNLHFSSLYALPVVNDDSRLLLQADNLLLYTDFPYTSSPQAYAHGIISGISTRLDYALCNGLVFFSNGQDNGYVIPPSPANNFTTRYQWGISPPPSPTLVHASTSWVAGAVTLQRAAGVLTVTFANPHSGVINGPCFIDSDPSATWPPSMQGLFQINSVTGPAILTILQTGLPDEGPFNRAAYPSGITATTGWQYGACYGASPVAHFSSLSPLSASTGPVSALSPVIMVPPTSDWQVDEVAFFRNQDSVTPGGGLWYLLDVPSQLITSGPYAGYAVFCDTITDLSLSTSGQTAPYDNGIAPQAKYLAVWLDRILACGIPSDPTAVRYTGYDSINFGRPQMSWCQYNEIKLGQGQAVPLGMGLLRYGGMVFFGTNGLMYIYRGTLNDITISAPTSLSFYAEQLPYNIGLFSHFSVQPTPTGLVWLDDGFNLRVMDNTGFYPPKAVAPQLTPIFERITPGSQDKVTSVHINYLQRDWYILSFPVDGSSINNMTVVVDLSQAANTGAWPVNHSCSGLLWTTYADRTGHLLVTQPQLNPYPDTPSASYLSELPISSPILQGIVDQTRLASDPPNLPMPGGFWRGGYLGLHDEQGEDQFSEMKMFRYLRIGSSLAAGLQVQGFFVNGEEWTWDNPVQLPFEMNGDVGGINQKARVMSPLLIFPDDVVICLNSLTASWIPVSIR